jgi:5-deoxy-glucuronate isomerase
MLIKPDYHAETRILTSITAVQADWQLLNMAVRQMRRGDIWTGHTEGFEYLHVILAGAGDFRTSRGDFPHVGSRSNVFAGPAHALYLPRDTSFELEVTSESFEVASCWVPTDQNHSAHLISPDDTQIDLRGGGNASRQVNLIMPPGFDCQHLVCVEAYIPGGNWAGYPPHKHDRHLEDGNGNLVEADLEEIYFYRFDPPTGFACQRVYTHDGTHDAIYIAQHNDTVLIPEGYHPTVGAPGYTTYLLNFLAGSAQSLANSDDPHHAWVKKEWNSLDPRLPVVTQETQRSV